MSNFTYHRRRWAAIPCDLFLNPNISWEAKAVAGILYASEVGDHEIKDYLGPLNPTETVFLTALEELKKCGLITFDEEVGHYNITILQGGTACQTEHDRSALSSV